MADSKISALTDGGGFQAADEIPVARAGANNRVSPIGIPVLVYRYTVAGVDKTAIDTGVDTADAGSNDWTNGDVLEIWVVARTDEAVVRSSAKITFNNDTGSNYDVEQFRALSTSVVGAGSAAAASISIELPGASATASHPSTVRGTIPTYAGTTFFKVLEILTGYGQATAAADFASLYVGAWRSTAAITRLAVTAPTGQKLKVGSQLLIYKRLAS